MSQRPRTLQPRRLFILSLVSFLGLYLLTACQKSPQPTQPASEPIAVKESPVEPDATVVTTGTTTLLPSSEALIAFKESWIYPTILNWRPSNKLEVSVNPPRFSWPYLQSVVTEDIEVIPSTVFTLQIARTADFAKPEINVVDTPYNFYNALPVLDAGTWYWRVGYGAAPRQAWSTARSFSIAPDAVAWDRSVINQAVEIIGQRARPRSGPPGGKWANYSEWLQMTPATKPHYDEVLADAERVMALSWWNDLPDTDVVPGGYETRDDKTRWVRMLKDATVVAYAYRLTGDRQYAGSLERILKMASWPRGGGLSPEALGGSTKMPSQAPEFFAVVYDWFASDLRSSERALLKEAIRWRLEIMYFDPENIIWDMGGQNMRNYGLAYVAGSHPYQNFAWTLPAILLMAGELDIADQLLPLTLNYLTGVTVPDGPEEGYNEGHGYSNEKGGTMLKASIATDLLFPELDVGKNPVVNGFSDWMIFMFPGAERLPWGDSWLTSARGVGGDNLRYVAYLTGDDEAELMWRERDGDISENIGGLYSRPWLDLLAYAKYKDRLGLPEDAALTESRLFLPEAGWVFVQSQPIQSMRDYYSSTGMQMQFRPRGGYGHSYPSDGSFVWYAYGQLLSCGGGWRSWASLDYSRDPISHNSLLIDGRGHDLINKYQPQRELTARPLAYEASEDYVYWAADLTPGYVGVEGVERVHRHVVFLDDKYFVIYDDLALADDAEPAKFSWLYHVYQDTPVEIDAASASFSYRIGSIFARVQFANAPESLAMENRIGQEGYLNPFTGKDAYPLDMERAKGRGIFKKYETEPLMHNNLWVTSSAAAKDFHFLSVLTAKKGEDAYMPELSFTGEKKVTLTLEDGRQRTVSFDPALPADIVIDVERVRTHAAESLH